MSLKKGLSIGRFSSAILVAVLSVCSAAGQVQVELVEQGAKSTVEQVDREQKKDERHSKGRSKKGLGAVVERSKAADPMWVSTLFGYAVECFLIGDTEQAKDRLEAIISLTNDTHAASRYYLSILSQQVRDIAKAREHINRAVVLDSSNIDFRKSQAAIMLDSGDFEAAKNVLEALIKESPNDIQLQIFYMLALFNSGHKAQMIDLANDYEARYGYDFRVSSMKSQFFIENKRFEELLAYSTKVAEASPTAENLSSLARVQASLGIDSLAIGNYMAAIALDDDISARTAFANYKCIVGDPVGAYALVRPFLMDSMVRGDFKVTLFTDLFKAGLAQKMSVDVRPIVDSVAAVTSGAEFHDFYIHYLLFSRDIDAALVQLQEAMSDRVLSKEMRIYLMQMYFEKKQLGLSLEVANQLHKDFADDSQIMGMIIFLNMEIGDMSEGLKMADFQVKVASNDSSRSAAYTSRGDFHQHFKQSKKAFDDYKKAVACDSLNATALNNWAYFTSTQDKVSERELQEALKRSILANRIEDLNPTFIDTEAWILYRLGRFTQARQKILLAIGLHLDKVPADLLMHSGDIFNALGERERAVNYWRLALEAGAKAVDVESRLNVKP